MSTEDQGVTTLLDLSGELIERGGDTDPYLEEVRGVVAVHLAIAERRTREESALAGFQELVHAARTLPMNARLAAGLVRSALRAGTPGPARTLITDHLDDAEGDELTDVQRQLARLARRSGDLELAQEIVVIILAERPMDRRARAVLNALLFRRERWEELDASLEKETKELIRREQFKAASRSALRRARLWGETLEDPPRAALRAMQAAQLAEQAKDLHAAFALRLLWLRNLHRATAPGRALEEATKLVLSLGDKVGQTRAARALVDELGLSPWKEDERTAGSTLSVSGERTPSASERRTTQLELMAIAESVARKPEAAALLHAATREGPDPQAAQKLEAHLIQRGAWRELGDFYREQVTRAATNGDKVRWGEKLAELLESELHDVEGAARAWADVAAATGDSRAVSEQVRLLEQKKDNSGVRHALDAGVRQARLPQEKARALVLRAQEALARDDADTARADFEAALVAKPDCVEAAVGLAELDAAEDDFSQLKDLERALRALVRRSPGRGDLYRRFARLADQARELKLARVAWAEVVAELPGDGEGEVRLAALTRAAGDDIALEEQLRSSLSREPRGVKARAWRLELVALFDRAGRTGEALDALKLAVRYEPGHREAWLLYADKLIEAGGRDEEAAWALEHAATATADNAARLNLWRRLATFCREVLGDEARAATYEQRAGKMKRDAMAVQEPTAQGPVPAQIFHLPRKSRSLKRRPTGSHLLTPAAPSEPRGRALIMGGAAAASRVVQRDSGETPVELGDPHAPLPSSFGPSPSRGMSDERAALFERVRANPLDADGYKLLAEHFDQANDPARSALMLEIARALEGDPHAAPRAPRLILTEADRTALKHPSLRAEAGELLSLVGVVLCRLNPARGREAGSNEEFTLDAGRGAKAVADAMLAAVRILGVRAPEVYLAQEGGPPLALVYTDAPRILVGRPALKKEVSDAELRFFAGRVLFTQQPELLALRSLRREQLLRGLVLVSQVAENRASSAEMKLFRDWVPGRSQERMKQLVRAVGSNVELAALVDGARHSANRAGLIVCGGVAPAIASLRAKRALPSEMIELVRFAASERHLQLRNRNLP